MRIENLYTIEDRLNFLIKNDKTNEGDLERRTLFYIVAGNYDLYSKVNYIYDFKDRSININCLENGEVDFCSSSYKLIKIGFNLYNGYNEPPSDILSLLSGLDSDNFNLAIHAIRMRFNMGEKSDYLIK